MDGEVLGSHTEIQEHAPIWEWARDIDRVGLVSSSGVDRCGGDHCDSGAPGGFPVLIATFGLRGSFGDCFGELVVDEGLVLVGGAADVEYFDGECGVEGKEE